MDDDIYFVNILILIFVEGEILYNIHIKECFRNLNFNHTPFSGGKTIECPGANTIADQAQGWVTDCCGHSSDLSIAPFQQGQRQPLCGYVFALPDRRRSLPQQVGLVY